MKFLTTLALATATLLQAQTIAIVNRTNSVSDATLKGVMGAVAKQVHKEFKTRWGLDATFVFVGKNQAADSKHWNVYIDQQKGDYHTVTKGVPVAYVHVKGVSTDYWTNTISHEVLEMRADPFVDQVVSMADGTKVMVEVCDACETNEQGYRIDNILMSDFVFPSWFKIDGTSPFDYRRLITAPFQVLEGGYLPTTSREQH